MRFINKDKPKTRTRRFIMKNVTRDLMIAAGKVDTSKVRLVVFVLTLAMFVLAAGAPDAGGDIWR
jgi:hypothetical protein